MARTPQQQTQQDYYEVLGVGPDATPQQLRRAWHRTSKKYHPDRYPSPTQKAHAEKQLQLVNAAYEVLSDPTQRRKYNDSRTAMIAHTAVHELVDHTAHLTAGVGVQAPHLLHRYTPGGKFVVFDGVTYMRLDEAAARLGQPIDRLQMYLASGELLAVHFDNHEWVTEASLVPLRLRQRPHIIGGRRTYGGPQPINHDSVLPPFGAHPQVAVRALPAPQNWKPRYTAPPKMELGRPASPDVDLAPQILLIIIGLLLYCMLANFSDTWHNLYAAQKTLAALVEMGG